jgi:hypothetical protein
MKLTEIQNLAIQARMAGLVGADIYDRLFAGIRFDELDGDLLYVAARNEDCATEIEDEFAPHIAVVASAVLKTRVEIVLVLPKVLQ